MTARQFVSPRPADCIFHVLRQREGHWMPTEDVMDYAGFRPAHRDPVTHRTSFHFHVEQLKRVVGAYGYDLYEQGDHLMLRANDYRVLTQDNEVETA